MTAAIDLTTLKTEHGPAFRNSGWVGKKQNLFTVSAGIDAADALNTASDLLDAAMTPIFDAGMGEPLEGNQAWLAHHAIESAKAVIDSVRQAMEAKMADSA